LLPRRLHVRGSRLGVLREWLPDRLLVGQLGIESSGPQVRDECAHEVGDRPVVKDERQQLALETARDLAPVTPDRLEANDLQLLSHEPGVSFLAPGGATAYLGHEEARVDLLELELEMARTAELARDRLGDCRPD